MLSAWLFFLIGAMLTYEVVARYFFNAPTIWAEEMSRVFLIWAVFLACASLLREDAHIRVTVLLDLAPEWVKRVARVVSLLFVAVISGFVALNGVSIAGRSFEVGRTTGTMLDFPAFILQASIPIGFALLCLQAVVLAILFLAGRDPLPKKSALSHD